MKVLMISDVYYPRVNGVSTSIQTFREELHQLDVMTTLIAPDYEGQDRLIYDTENDIIRVPSRKVILDPEDRFLKKGFLNDIYKLIENRKFDLIHIQTPFTAHYLGMAIREKLKIPVIETYHTFFEEYFYHYIPFLPKSWLRFVARWFSRMQCNQLDSLVVPSTAMLEKLQEYGITVDMKIIPTGVTMPKRISINSDDFKHKHGIPIDRPVLLHVGRVAFEKNINFLIDTCSEVIKLMPEVVFVITGEGPAKKNLLKKVTSSSLEQNIIFIDYLDRSTSLPACYEASDIFVFASRTETQGLVLLEAMAMGLPVISTAEMGTKDILRPGKGAIVAIENTRDFSGKIIALLKDKRRLKLMSEEAVRYAETWAADVMAEKMLEYYNEIINQNQSSSRLTQSDNYFAPERG